MTVISPFIEPRKQDDRLIRREYKMLIGGKSVDAQSGERIERESPAAILADIDRAFRESF